ncbi:TRAP transporter small permease [Jannaschia sp. LMIT008]|uniref:TRAP transporter small permease n=1 Tax=Jannaschia maritima TaxID=3032585 RepID=UPI0028124CC5|nr:TRAP transporter small permease subunit [Jannaschia sp. LMIT008]
MTPGPADADGVVLPAGLRWVRAALHWIGRCELAVAALLLAAVIALSAAQALLRYAFGTSIWWAQEVGLTAVMGSYFLGASYVFKSRQYIVIEFLTERLPHPAAAWLYVVVQIATATTCIVIVAQFVAFAPTLGVLRTPILGIPKLYPTMPLIACLVLIVPTSLYYAAAALAYARQAGAFDSIARMEAAILLNEPR